MSNWDIGRPCTLLLFDPSHPPLSPIFSIIAIPCLDDTFRGHALKALPPNFTVTSRQELLDFYREMSLIRQLELASDALYKQREILGFLHLYTGQEAVLCGFDSVLTPQDSVITAYRDHGFMLTRRCGGTAKETLAELTGRITGCSKGKGGSMHLYKKDANFYGGNGIVGAQVPLGTGLAFANKFLNNGSVSVVYMGDGAANQGQVYESFNMASLWKLPVIYVIENNLYGMGTSVDRASATSHFYTRGDYIPGLMVDGMNVLAVREAAKFAVNWIKEGHGPLLIEAKTYRYYGHSISDPGTSYRTRSDVDQMRASSDCINVVKNWILGNQLCNEEELSKIQAQVKQEIKEAVQFAIESPKPEPKELFSNVYSHPTRVRAVECCESYQP